MTHRKSKSHHLLACKDLLSNHKQRAVEGTDDVFKPECIYS